MNKIYNQGLGRESWADNACIGCSIANLNERKTGKAIPLQSIFDWYDKVGLAYDSTKFKPDGGGSNNVPTAEKVLARMKLTPMNGIEVSDSRLVWSSKGKLAQPPLLVLWDQLKEGYFVFVVKSGFKLTPECDIIPVQGLKKSLHAMALIEPLENGRGKKFFRLENSKGRDWGVGGCCYLNLLDLPEEVVEIWEVKFA